MRSSVSLLLAVCVTAPAIGQPKAPIAALPPELATAQGPSATSGEGAERYDRVGMATQDETGEAISAAHRSLPAGSIAEVTALDSGKTILVRIGAHGLDDARAEIALTRGAAGLLGLTGPSPVRVRAVTASPADASALARGQPASPRIDAPPALLAALRRQLPAIAAQPSAPRRAVAPSARFVAPPRSPPSQDAASAPVRGRYLVQVGAFSTRDRAAAVASALGGSVQPAGALWRVRLGPYRDSATAQRARDGAVRRGYAGAQIIPAS